MPVVETPEQETTFWGELMSVVRNLMHVPMYGVLTLVLLHYFECIRFSRPAGALVSAVMAMFLGIAVELLQIYVPGRYCSISDIGLNFAGIIGAMILFFKFCFKAEK